MIKYLNSVKFMLSEDQNAEVSKLLNKGKDFMGMDYEETEAYY